MKNKSIIWAVAIVILIAAAYGISGSVSTGPAKEIRIGVIAPLNGGAVVFGKSFVKGIELAQQDLKGAGHTYKVIVEDDGSNAAQAASAAQKLISVDKVDAILTVTSTTGNAAKPIAEKAGIVHICDCADVSIGSGTYNFTNSIMPDNEIPGWLSEAKAQGVKTVAIINQIHPGITPVVNYLVKRAPDYGITVTYQESFDGATKDFKTIISKLKQKPADIYFIAAYPPAEDILAKQLIDSGVTNISTYALFAVSPTPEIYNGKWYTDANLSDPSFAERFALAYPDTRFNVRTAPYGYDMFNMLVQGFEKGSVMSSYLKNLSKYEGKVGTISKAADSSNFRSQPGLWKIEDGKAKILRVI